MFVRKSTYDDMLAQAQACSAMAEALAEELNKTIAERDALRAELATTYVHDAKGRIARHPSASQPNYMMVAAARDLKAGQLVATDDIVVTDHGAAK